MSHPRYVAYCRVSTTRQGQSGLGLEAQRQAVSSYLRDRPGRLVAELVEIESGAKSARPQLQEAMSLCRAHRATLVVAKLDRLARDAHFLLGLQKEGVDFVAVDMPSANRMVVGILASVAEEEREMIKRRTKAALAAAKARGVKLGGRRKLRLAVAAGEAAKTALRAATKAREAAGTDAAAKLEREARRAADAAAAARKAVSQKRRELEAVRQVSIVKAREARTAGARRRALALEPLLRRLDPDGSAPLLTVAARLNEEGVPTATGKGVWTAAAVARVRRRLSSEF